MSESRSGQLAELLRLAKVRPLTREETEMLQNLLATDEGNRVIEYHLETSYPKAAQERSWSSAELTKIAAEIDQKVVRRSHKQNFSLRVQRMAWVTAVIVCLFGGAYLWLLNSQPQFEPAIQFEVDPTQTPLPTPTLQARHQYADLLNAPVTQTTQLNVDDYLLTIPEAVEVWDSDLYLPVQMADSWTFLGAATHTAEDGTAVVELAFVQKSLGREDLWILSQAVAEGRPLNPPLPVVYQPLDDVNEINSYEDKPVEVGDLPAHGYQYEFVDRDKTPIEWVVYNTVTWQQGEQLMTLTLVADNNFPTSVVALTAGKLDLRLQTDK